jgi:hypothetical protein
MRVLLLIAVLLAAAAIAGCSSPPNQPCFYHQGVRSSQLSQNGHTLVVVCTDGVIVTRHP